VGKPRADTVTAASVIHLHLGPAAPPWRCGELWDLWVDLAGAHHDKIVVSCVLRCISKVLVKLVHSMI